MWQPIASNDQSCVQFECHSRTLAFPSMTWFGKKGVNSWMWIEWDCSHQPYESPFSSMNWHSQCCTFKDQFECQFKIELSGMCECWFHSELGTSLHGAQLKFWWRWCCGPYALFHLKFREMAAPWNIKMQLPYHLPIDSLTSKLFFKKKRLANKECTVTE